MTEPLIGKRRPALWAGFECTVCRIGDVYRDQSRETGHDRRESDIDRAAGLGVEALRYPVLWDQAPDDDGDAFWRRHDRRLARIAELGMEAICGLTHHGSGPVDTGLLDPRYPQALAAHARRVAERYPDLATYTPVNEPLTTARFTCLYGHWHPHETGEKPFLRALFHQCLGVVLAMREVRKVNPDARLLQTEDLGRVFSTPQLAYQADYENGRRWLSFDLLMGRVRPDHRFHRALLDAGVSVRDLDALADAPCPPDVFGINHYLSSDRFLDHRINDYPATTPGGNGRHRYVDLLAARASVPHWLLGPKARLKEAADRYGAPIAVTEVHNGSTRDEQLRWLREVWTGACELADEGVDVRAVTLWSLVGAVDWASLLTRHDGAYEPGAFDIRGDPPRPTAIARAARRIANTGDFDHPSLDGLGWWHRGDRFERADARRTDRVSGPRRKLRVTDPSSPLGMALAAACRKRDLALAEADDRGIWALIDTRDEPNASAALSCGAMGIPLVAFSTHQVFAPRREHQYTESESPCPVSRLGARAQLAEHMAMNAPATMLVRTGARFATGWADTEATALGADKPPRLPTLTYLPDLVEVVLDLLIDEAWGTWHLVNSDSEADSKASGDFMSSLAYLGTERGVLLPPLAQRWQALATLG